MTTRPYKQASPELKLTVAAAAYVNVQTRKEIAEIYNVDEGSISRWSLKLEKYGPQIFQRGSKGSLGKDDSPMEPSERDRLHLKIGQLTMENGK